MAEEDEPDSKEPEGRAPARSLALSPEARMRMLGSVAGVPAAFLTLIAPIAWISDEFLAMTLVVESQIAMAFWALALFAPPVVAWLASTRSDGRLTAAFDEDGLRVNDVRLARDELAMAWTRDARTVEVITHGGDELRLTLDQPVDAESLVHAIRRAADGRRAYPVRLESDGLRLMRKVWAWMAPLTLSLPFLWSGPKLGLPALLIGAGLGWLGSRGDKRLRFGADGVSLEGRFKKRYLPYGEIARVSLARTVFGWFTLRLVTTRGERITVSSMIGRERATLLRALLEEGVSMHEAGLAAGAHVAELDRGEDEPERWRVRVEAATREGGYRGAALDPERLLSLMRNPAATPEQRVGAALALRSDPGGVARIRVAAEVSTEPAVREAFETLAEEELDQAQIEKVIRRLGA